MSDEETKDGTEKPLDATGEAEKPADAPAEADDAKAPDAAETSAAAPADAADEASPETDGDEARPETDGDEARPETDGDEAKPKKPASAGARLAAQRAAKAAQKAAKRGRQKNEVEVQANKRAEKISKWYEEHRVPVLAAVGAAALLIVGFVAWNMYGHSGDVSAADALAKAVKTSVAVIRDPDEPTPPDQPVPDETYPTLEARTRRTLTEMQDVVRRHAGTRAAVWARLGQARAMLDLGQHAQAREELEKVIHEADGDVTVLARAYEGIAFSYEAEGKTADAVTKFQALSHAGDGAFRDLAEYHLARMYLAQHQNDRAKETLRVLVTRLRERNDNEDGAASPFVLAQAEIRLGQLDSSLVPRGAGGPPGGGMMIGPNGERMGGGAGAEGQITPEQIQELIRQMQEKNGGGPPPGGGAPHGGGGGAPPGGGE